MKRFAMAQMMNQSNRTDAAACAPACFSACAQTANTRMFMDTAILAVSIFVCLCSLIGIIGLIFLSILLVLSVCIMKQLNIAESRNAKDVPAGF